MKYGEHNTFKGHQTKKHGHGVKPARTRYFAGLTWLKNKAKKIAKQLKFEEKKRRRNEILKRDSV